MRTNMTWSGKALSGDNTWRSWRGPPALTSTLPAKPGGGGGVGGGAALPAPRHASMARVGESAREICNKISQKMSCKKYNKMQKKMRFAFKFPWELPAGALHPVSWFSEWWNAFLPLGWGNYVLCCRKRNKGKNSEHFSYWDALLPQNEPFCSQNSYSGIGWINVREKCSTCNVSPKPLTCLVLLRLILRWALLRIWMH